MSPHNRDQLEAWMALALEAAREALGAADVPVGAIVVSPAGEVIGRGYNTREKDHSPVGHAEINALLDAAATLGTARLDGCSLVVTLEPCVMCAGAIGQSGVSTLIYGAADPKAGAAGGGPHDLVRDRALPYRVDEVIGGVRAEESAALLSEFFTQLRD
jgi:tRNA(adenine34) deaminase